MCHEAEIKVEQKKSVGDTKSVLYSMRILNQNELDSGSCLMIVKTFL